MICEKCGKDKPDTMKRLGPNMPKGVPNLDGTFCTRCCIEVLPDREWMRASIPDHDETESHA